MNRNWHALTDPSGARPQTVGETELQVRAKGWVADHADEAAAIHAQKMKVIANLMAERNPQFDRDAYFLDESARMADVAVEIAEAAHRSLLPQHTLLEILRRDNDEHGWRYALGRPTGAE